jgi:hypothetical protein
VRLRLYGVLLFEGGAVSGVRAAYYDATGRFLPKPGMMRR